MKIEHISEVLPHIEGRKEFYVAERDGYTVIDYAITTKDSFDDPVRRECRGIKFKPDGSVLARPFHKFFNIGERESTQPHLVDFSKPHRIMDKLDGSLIHGCLLGDDVVFMTRWGRSSQALESERLFLRPILSTALWLTLRHGITPIFEYTGPKNRHIIEYEKPELTLLAGRHAAEGTYLSYEECAKWAANVGLPIVPQVDTAWEGAMAFLSFVRALHGKEGYVLWFDPEHEDEPERRLLKCKGDDYVLKHKTKEAIQLEKNVLALILQNGVDDVLPLLSKEDKDAIERYKDAVLSGLNTTVEQLDALVTEGSHLDQKAFATEHLAGLPGDIRGLAFATRRNGDAGAEVRKHLLKGCGTQTAVDAMRHLFGAEYIV